MFKKTFKELLSLIEVRPPESLARGLSYKILWHEMRSPRFFLLLASLPAGLYFAFTFVVKLIANDVIPAVSLAISNFELSAEYIFGQISFIQDFFPYEELLLTLILGVIFVWTAGAIKKQFNHITKLNHII